MARINQGYKNEGFAIWINGKDDEYCSDIHINEWINPNFQNYIDFGIRILEFNHIDTLNIYVPFLIDRTEVEDLSEKLSQEDVARGIFNTTCTITSSSSRSITEIKYNNRKENILIFDEQDISVQKTQTDSIITFQLQKFLGCITSRELYIRIRIPHKSLDSLFSNRKLNYKFLFESPNITNIYEYVIRINEMRSLPKNIIHIDMIGKQNIKKIIISMSLNYIYEIDRESCYKIRKLEKELYKNYVPTDFSCDDIATYQWLIENKTRYNFNFKFYYTKLDKKSLCIYALIVIILSCSGSALFELISYLFKLLFCK